MKLIPIWAQAAIAAVVIAIIFGSGYKVATWKWSGKVEKAVAAKDAAIAERDTAVALEAQWRLDIKTLKDQMETDALERSRLQAAYDEAVSKPPEIVIRYRDRWRDIPTTIVSEDCNKGVGELFTFLASLPDRPQQ